MSKSTSNTANVQSILGKKNNAVVTSSKQTLHDENGKEVRSLYYITITTDKGTLVINTGETNYKKIKELAP